MLYPLFCHDLKRLVSSQTPGGGGLPTAMSIPPDRRRLGPPTSRSTPVSQAPALPHPQTMPPHMSQPTTQSLSSQSAATRPSLGRAHTFPAPPTSSSNLMGVTNQGNSYDWQGPNMGNSVHGAPPPLSIDSGLSNARSMPTTPAATTPSGSGLNSMYPSQSSYDPNKSYYSAAQPSQQHYMPQQSMPQSNMTR
jgi:protein SOK2